MLCPRTDCGPADRLTSGKLSIFEGHELSGLHIVIDNSSRIGKPSPMQAIPLTSSDLSSLGYQFSLYRPDGFAHRARRPLPASTIDKKYRQWLRTSSTSESTVVSPCFPHRLRNIQFTSAMRTSRSGAVAAIPCEFAFPEIRTAVP